MLLKVNGLILMLVVKANEVTPMPASEVTPLLAREVIPMLAKEVIPMLAKEVIPMLAKEVTPIQRNDLLPTPAKRLTLMLQADQYKVSKLLLRRTPHKVKHRLQLTLRKVTLPLHLMLHLHVPHPIPLIQLRPNQAPHMQLKVMQAPHMPLKVMQALHMQLKVMQALILLKVNRVLRLTPLKAKTVELVMQLKVMLNMQQTHRQRVCLISNPLVFLLLPMAPQLQHTVHNLRLLLLALHQLATVTVTARSQVECVIQIQARAKKIVSCRVESSRMSGIIGNLSRNIKALLTFDGKKTKNNNRKYK